MIGFVILSLAVCQTFSSPLPKAEADADAEAQIPIVPEPVLIVDEVSLFIF